MARFFIDRPVFAWVISILIILFGGIALNELPIAQYPTIAPPAVSIRASYTGASANVTQDTVTTIIEQQLNGIDNLLYVESSSSNSGDCEITCYFNAGTNPDTAQVQVQNKVSQAEAMLPEAVQRQGVQVRKSARNIALLVTLYSDDNSLSGSEIGNYSASSLLDPLQRIDGVGEVMFFGSENAMRIWLNPDKLLAYSLTPVDVISALNEQNIQVPVGQLGGAPAKEGAQFYVPLKGRATFTTPTEFENIVLKVRADGSQVYMKDIARVELGGDNYAFMTKYNGKNASGLAIKLASDANIFKVSKLVKDKMEELSKAFPASLKVAYPLDSSLFVDISVQQVQKTLIEAVVLVFLVILIFLQNFRATLIPTIVIPVALLGTCVMLYALGYSINVLTLFAMVLAIGILVDDAIVVIENVERIMTQEGLSPRDATIKAMKQISGALIGITAVLSFVFVPMAFFSGSVGIIYRQFSIALISSMGFSLLLAFTLTPALCATFLKPTKHGARNFILTRYFNLYFEKMTSKYKLIVSKIIHHLSLGIISLLAISAAVVYCYWKLPTAFLPDEDQGYTISMIQLPQGSTQEQTIQLTDQLTDFSEKQPEVLEAAVVHGFSFAGTGENVAISFSRLKDWSLREGEAHSAQNLAKRIIGYFSQNRMGAVFAMVPPPIPELGTSSGFEYQMQNFGGVDAEMFTKARQALLAELSKPSSKVMSPRFDGMEDTPMLNVLVDEEKAKVQGVDLTQINTVIQSAFASFYVNNYVQGNRVQRVRVQLDEQYRASIDDIKNVYVRSNSGTMVPLSELVNISWGYGSPALKRYNGFSSFKISGQVKPGYSTGEAMKEIEDVVANYLPSKGFTGIRGMWSGQSLEEKTSGAQAPALYALSLIVVFLCLAALYESWTIPLAVILVVPVGILGSLLATMMAGQYNDVYFKVGFLVIVGLSTKNAILIIEFAKEIQENGRNLYDSVVEACHLRLRPILMTSFAFILGVLPLAKASGASSAAQNSIGVGVVGGMLSATILGVFLIPCFYVLVRRLFKFLEKEPNSPSIH